MKDEDNMAPLKHHRAAELELLEALSDVVRKEPGDRHVGNCPSVADLKRFAAGTYGTTEAQRDELLAHLAVCDHCVHFLAQLRKRRVFTTKAALALASAAVVAVAFWVSLQHTSQVLSGVATVDLRLISPTRGQVPGPQTATVRKTTGGLRVVLPVGSEGNYEVEILGQDKQPAPILRSSGSTRLEGHGVVLNLPVNLANLKSGKYLLALRRDGSEWEYYSVILE
jgi:hypothetical protein